VIRVLHYYILGDLSGSNKILSVVQLELLRSEIVQQRIGHPVRLRFGHPIVQPATDKDMGDNVDEVRSNADQSRGRRQQHDADNEQTPVLLRFGKSSFHPDTDEDTGDNVDEITTNNADHDEATDDADNVQTGEERDVKVH
jgi:hypothetical protein